MPLPLIVLASVICALDVFILLLPRILRSRGVFLYPRTKFGPALVFDSNDDEGTEVRLLNVGGKFQSICYVAHELRYRLVCVYHLYFSQVVQMQGEVHAASAEGRDTRRKALVIGGGGYSFPKWLVSDNDDVDVTVVEIDEVVTKIAREHFYLDELIREFDAERGGRLRLVCDDGWAFLGNADERFDIIVNDAFGGRKPLGPLATQEGAQAVLEHLSPTGVYLANVISPLEGSAKKTKILRDSLDACKDAFEHVYLIPEDGDDPTIVGDNVLAASNARLPLAKAYVIK